MTVWAVVLYIYLKIYASFVLFCRGIDKFSLIIKHVNSTNYRVVCLEMPESRMSRNLDNLLY